MNDNINAFIKEQIEFLKADLHREVPLNMGSEFQPEAAARINDARETTKQQIVTLLEQLAKGDNTEDEKQYYRSLLERIAGDKSALEIVKDAVDSFDDDEERRETIVSAVSNYEMSKREISKMILEKLI